MLSKFFLSSLLLLSSSIVYGWGAPDLLPADQREKTITLDTKLDKKKAFSKISIWSAKTFVNSNEAIKLKDADAGVLVAKGNISCEALKLGSGYGKDQIIDFTLEITAEDKKVEVKVSDLVGKSAGSYDDGARPSKAEEMEAVVKECLIPFIDKLKKDLN